RPRAAARRRAHGQPRPRRRRGDHAALPRVVARARPRGAGREPRSAGHRRRRPPRGAARRPPAARRRRLTVLRRVRAVLGVLLGAAAAHRLRPGTTLLGIAVGVAVVVAIRLASDAALDSFRRAYATLAGGATHQVVARQPMPAARLADLARAPGVLAAQPV